MRKFLLLIIISGLSCCKQDDFSYFDSYTGSWQFMIYRKSWGYYSGYKYDTIHYKGSINRIQENRGLRINFLENEFADVWVEDDTILYEINKIGAMRDRNIDFVFIRGTLRTGNSYKISGTKIE